MHGHLDVTGELITMEHWWNGTAEERIKLVKNTCGSGMSCSTLPTWNGLESNQGNHNEALLEYFQIFCHYIISQRESIHY